MPFFYSNNDDDFFLHRWNFRLKTFVEDSEMGIYLLVQKTVVHNFFADSAKYISVATVHSSNGIKSFFY